MIKSIQDLAMQPIDTPETIKENWSEKDLKLVKFLDDKVVEIDLGSSKQVFIKHTRETITTSEVLDEENLVSHEKEIDYAYSIVCKKPVTYGRLINAAIRQEFSAEDGEIEAINRKRFTDPSDPEITAHDTFVKWVKAGLKEIGWKGDE